jgi:thiamine-phosphate pyrophosphorylase
VQFATGESFPRFYPILDIGTLRRISSGDGDFAVTVKRAASTFFAAGVEVLQLRAKDCEPQEVLAWAAAIREARDAAGSCCMLILNDRPDLALLAGYDGCHLGQEDLSIAGARRILPSPKILGQSTHDAAQLKAAADTSADYLAIGPTFATATKENPSPVVGLNTLRDLRMRTMKPLVAIGGVTRANARSVLDAGADSVAIIGDLFTGCDAANLEKQLMENVRDILARIL